MAFAAVERLYLSVSCQVLCVLLHVSDRRDQKPAAQGSPTPKPGQTPIRVRGRLAWTRGAVRGAEGGAGAVANSPVTARPALSWPGPAGSPHTHSCAPCLGVTRAPPWDPEALSLHLFPCGPVLRLQLPWIFLGARLCLFHSASTPVPAECLHPGVRPGDPLPSVVWGYHRAHFVTPDSGVGSRAA